MNVIVILIFSLLIVFSYWKLPNTFFQQDEWQQLISLTYYASKGIPGIIESFLPLDPVSHFNPLARAFVWYEYIFYYTNFSFYAWQSIILHIINTLLLYYFVHSWFKRKVLSIVSALVFAVNRIPNQAITWVAGAESYEIPALFILLSLIFFQRFVDQQNYGRRNLFLSLASLLISLLFHENGLFLFLFYPAIILIKPYQIRKKLLPLLVRGIGLLIIIYFSVRIPFFFGFLSPEPQPTDTSRPSVAVYPTRFISITLKSFAGNIFAEKTLITLSEQMVRLSYPQFLESDNIPNPYITQSIVFDLVSYILTLCIVCVIILLLKIIRVRELLDGYFWSLLYVPISLLPYGLVLGRAGFASISDSKFYYISSIGIAILFGIIFFTLLTKFRRSKVLVVCIFLFFGIFLLRNIFSIKILLEDLEAIGVQRKKFLTTIKASYAKLPQKVIFFTESDTAYYGMPEEEKILPVQVGFGRMLMFWYQESEKFPMCFYDGIFLRYILAQGYRECGGRGFGYFRKYPDLLDTVKTNVALLDNVVSFSWNGRHWQFIDTTKIVKEKLREDLDE